MENYQKREWSKEKERVKWCISVVVQGAFTGPEPKTILEHHTQIVFTMKEVQYSAKLARCGSNTFHPSNTVPAQTANSTESCQCQVEGRAEKGLISTGSPVTWYTIIQENLWNSKLKWCEKKCRTALTYAKVGS